MSTLRYRPDIDGLRAVAVLLVLLYHADLWDVNGGFIGVDVFFVISGFLITSLIRADLEKGTFSFRDFWERRIRRILPALAVVTAATFIAGWFLFLPDDYAVLGKQAAAQTVFSSNILFYSLSGYFAAENTTKPLLHTWSLAVEEQYYFIVPFLLAGLYAKFRKNMVAVLAVLAVASFAGSVWAVKYEPDAAFYLLPFRAWELLVGSLLAFMPHSKAGRFDEKINNMLALAGLVAIFGAAFTLTPKSPFPGMAALLPCFGAACIIHAGRSGHSTMIGRILSSKPVVAVGLISYSLYLWHWPVLMFAEYVPLIELHSVHRIGLLLLSALLAYLPWKYVEQPCRRKRASSSQSGASSYMVAVAGLVVFALVGLFIATRGGMPTRWTPQALQYAQGAHDGNPQSPACVNRLAQKIDSIGLCESNPKGGKIDFIVWGDSFADSAMPLFYELSKKYGNNGYMAAYHSCPPIIGALLKNSEKSPGCHDFNRKILEIIEKEKIKYVFLVSNWEGWFKNNSIYYTDMDWYAGYKERYSNTVAAGTQKTLDALKDIGARPYVVISAPILSFNAPLMLAFEEQFGVMESKSFTPYEDYRKQRAKAIDPLVENQNEGVTVIDLSPMFCEGETCRAEKDGYSLYRDRTHLSAHGILYTAPLFETYFQKM